MGITLILQSFYRVAKSPILKVSIGLYTQHRSSLNLLDSCYIQQTCFMNLYSWTKLEELYEALSSDFFMWSLPTTAHSHLIILWLDGTSPLPMALKFWVFSLWKNDRYISSGNFTYFRSLIIFMPRKNARKARWRLTVSHDYKGQENMVNEWRNGSNKDQIWEL